MLVEEVLRGVRRREGLPCVHGADDQVRLVQDSERLVDASPVELRHPAADDGKGPITRVEIAAHVERRPEGLRRHERGVGPDEPGLGFPIRRIGPRPDHLVGGLVDRQHDPRRPVPSGSCRVAASGPRRSTAARSARLAGPTSGSSTCPPRRSPTGDGRSRSRPHPGRETRLPARPGVGHGRPVGRTRKPAERHCRWQRGRHRPSQCTRPVRRAHRPGRRGEPPAGPRSAPGRARRPRGSMPAPQVHHRPRCRSDRL